jgi:GT2 family glycosyltransferase
MPGTSSHGPLRAAGSARPETSGTGGTAAHTRASSRRCAPPAGHALACVAVVTYNSAGCIAECLSSLRREQRDLPHIVVVLDNASEDASTGIAESADPDARIIRSDANVGFGQGNNRALADRNEPFVALVNPDCELRAGALRRAVDYLEAHPDVGIVGARLLDADGRDTTVDRLFTTPWREITGVIDSALWLRARIAVGTWWWRLRGRAPARPAEWVIGAFMVMPRHVWERVGGFDPDFFMYGEDTDLCWRVRRLGCHVAIHPGVVVTHLGDHSAGPAFGDSRRERHVRAHVLAYAKRSGPGGAGRLIRAMRVKLRVRLLVLGLRERLLRDASAARRRKRPEAVLAILDRLAAETH